MVPRDPNHPHKTLPITDFCSYVLEIKTIFIGHHLLEKVYFALEKSRVKKTQIECETVKL